MKTHLKIHSGEKTIRFILAGRPFEEVGLQTFLVTNSAPNLSPNSVTNSVITKFGAKYGDKFGDKISEHPFW